MMGIFYFSFAIKIEIRVRGLLLYFKLNSVSSDCIIGF